VLALHTENRRRTFNDSAERKLNKKHGDCKHKDNKHILHRLYPIDMQNTEQSAEADNCQVTFIYFSP